MDEISKEKWEKLGEYIWSEVEKGWPHFWSDDIQELDFFVKEHCNINVGPDELERLELIDKINMYLDSHRLSLSLLPDKYKELENDIELFKELAHDIYIDWLVGRGASEFDIETDRHFKEDFKEYLIKMKEKLGFNEEKVELIAYFSGPNISEEIIKKAKECIAAEYEKFLKKWNPILKKETEIANSLLKEIVNQRIFKNDKTLDMEKIMINTKDSVCI